MSNFNPIQSSVNIKNDIMLSQVGLRGQEVGYLTPDMLLAFCASKLRGIDEQVQRAFAGQQDRNKLSAKLADLASELQSANHIDAGDHATKDAIASKFDAAIALAGPNTDLGKDLQGQKDAFMKTATGTDPKNNDPGVDANEIKNFVDSIGRTQSTVNREGELEMIQLQSLMSQRQQALQMCTNMVAGLGQSSTAIAQNIGK